MLAKYERRVFDDGSQVWISRYRNLRNLPHWHFESELIACQEGSAKVILDGRAYTLSKGLCLFCRSESVHYIIGGGESMLAVAQFGRLLPQNCWLTEPLFADRYGVSERMNDIDRESKSDAPFRAERVNAMMAQLLIDILRGEKTESGSYNESASFARYRELLGEIEQRCDEFSFEEAASFMNMSDAYFSRFFKRAAGMTFSRYLNVVRVDRAIGLMSARPDVTMTELMGSCGFNTLRNFNRVFKDITGYAPTALPDGFVLNYRSLATEDNSFDPTLAVSEVLAGTEGEHGSPG